MRRERRRSSVRAFTVAELIVVLVILALAAGMAIPYVASTGDTAVASAARMVACDLQYAQNMAITTQSPVTVSFDLGGEGYTLSNTSGVLIHPINKSNYVVDFGSQRGFGGLDIVTAIFGVSQSVTFDEMGAPDNAGTVTLQDGPHSYTVRVAAGTGYVTVAAGS